jgi:hypothetical protein
VNAFLDLAERQVTAPVKAKRRAVEKRAEQHAAKTDEQKTCLKQWHRWRREQLDEALNGPHGPAIAALLDQLKNANSWAEIDPAVLLGAWHAADADTQFIVRRLISDRVIELRERAQLAPFDDPIPAFGEAP